MLFAESAKRFANREQKIINVAPNLACQSFEQDVDMVLFKLFVLFAVNISGLKKVILQRLKIRLAQWNAQRLLSENR